MPPTHRLPIDYERGELPSSQPPSNQPPARYNLEYLLLSYRIVSPERSHISGFFFLQRSILCVARLRLRK